MKKIDYLSYDDDAMAQVGHLTKKINELVDAVGMLMDWREQHLERHRDEFNAYLESKVHKQTQEPAPCDCVKKTGYLCLKCQIPNPTHISTSVMDLKLIKDALAQAESLLEKKKWSESSREKINLAIKEISRFEEKPAKKDRKPTDMKRRS